MSLVDLFSGCGGFSLGAHLAGYSVAAAFDNDAVLTSSFGKNFPNTPLWPENIAKLDGEAIRARTKQPITGVFGGPPCQGFSDIGRRDVDDPRRQLLGHFFRIVAELKPSFFVMENVKGLAYADARGVLDEGLRKVEDRYAIMEPTILDAADFGAATKRRRLFVIGVHKDAGDAMSLADFEPYRRKPATVEAALADLQSARFLEEDDEGFDRWRITKRGPAHAYAKRLRSDGYFTSHRTTEHRHEVAKRFAEVPPGGMDAVGRHPRLHWQGQCPTLRAGTGSDRGSYQAVRPLHPDEPRVITVREAARLQGFPDSHLFHPTVWHSFRMIGNSVSPIVAQAIFQAIAIKMGDSERSLLAAE